MTTELLLRDDAYLKTATARVANISEIGGIRVTRIKSAGRQNKRVEIVLVD